MKTKQKALVLTFCAMLLVIATVSVTVAYLTSSDSVTNTFTVGKVAITLDETDVDVNGVKDSEKRVKENSYKLMPGHTYTKDPVVHVSANSEDCWVFVKVVNELEAIEDATTVEAQMTANGWSAVSDAENVYAYKKTVSAGEDIELFKTFTIKGDATGDALAAYENKTIVVTAYAIQADGFETSEEAWAAGNF